MPTAIIIVSYGQGRDVADCLRAVDDLEDRDEAGVFVVENAGPDAFRVLADELVALSGTPGQAAEAAGLGPRHTGGISFHLPGSKRSVVIAQATGNLGYAGGVNSWLEQHTLMGRWTGFWILNPDTAPRPRALVALIEACESSGCGMAGSVIVDYERQNRVLTRGLMWRPWLGSVVSVDQGTEVSASVGGTRSDIDAPSGTSIYVTRSCLEAIGFMDEDYFLYFEDVDWGLRAKEAGLLCSAEASHVPHKYGSALGSAIKRSERSRLSVYLDTRNALLFTRRHDPWFTAVTAARLLMRAAEYLVIGSRQNCASALSGLAAGLRGERGRPSRPASGSGDPHRWAS